jgi:hypothetical protein
VIGQAGIPGQCGPPNAFICTSIAATTDGGQTWHGVPAPVAGAPDGARGVSQIRSLDGVNGWAFGPQLYATHDGGQAWRRIATHGMRVVDLETVGRRAFAVWASCTGSGPDFAGNCTSFSLYSSPAGLDAWAPVRGVTGLTSVRAAGTTPHASAVQLTLTGSRGYLLSPGGYVISGPVDRGAGWHGLNTGNAGCGVSGPAQPDGLPTTTMLAATVTGTGLVEMCMGPAPGGRQGKTVLYSPDGGASWQTAGDAPSAGTATSLAVSPTGQVLIATTHGIDVSANAVGGGPLRWRAARGASAPGGYTFVGMTTAIQGVAVPADTSLHAVWFTSDGGRHWQESPVH